MLREHRWSGTKSGGLSSLINGKEEVEIYPFLTVTGPFCSFSHLIFKTVPCSGYCKIKHFTGGKTKAKTLSIQCSVTVKWPYLESFWCWNPYCTPGDIRQRQPSFIYSFVYPFVESFTNSHSILAYGQALCWGLGVQCWGTADRCRASVKLTV